MDLRIQPVVDRKILQFAPAHTFTPGDFTINHLGGCRLNSQTANIVSSQVATLPAGHVVRELLTAAGSKVQKSGPARDSSR
jgi:hypothetical protein